MICLNGAAARHVQVGDVVIIMSYGMFTDEEAKTHEPKIVVLDEKNHIEMILPEEKAHTTL
ncbi:aspartate alpha-decarboxylase [Listeria monocytogenes FSL F6-684]|nr:aspartate alpha-decarboxylase [Listeria monocytogenes FSL F6-684]